MKSSLPQDVQAVLDNLVKQSDLACVILFGSVATGKFNNQSDIDVAVAKQSKLTTDEFLSIVGKITPFSPRKIDLIDLHAAHPPLSQEIFKNGIWLKKDPQIYYQILKRTLFEVEDFLPLKQRIQKTRVERFTK